jgi:hypothetical protein
MLSRERIKKAINHEQPDKLPVDFGSTPVTGIHVSIVYKLRQHFGLDKPKTPVKVIEPFQMLGEIGDDLKEIIGVDISNLEDKGTFFGYSKENWKEWTFWDGTPVLVPELFNTDLNQDDSIFQYAKGDKNYPPSSKMPKKGYFFDSIIRQKPLEDDDLNPYDNTEEFKLLSESEIKYLKNEVDKIYDNTDYAIFGIVASSGFGDIAFVPGPMLPNPKGIRDIEEWYISTLTRKEYIKKVFQIQCEIAIENYKKVFNSIGNKINVVYISGTDFGAQDRLFSSIDTYKELFKPFHSKVNNWIHENTNWKCFIHSCGAIFDLIPELIEAGFDIINPVQISAKGMDPKKLKTTYGRHVTFWGGGVNTQMTLPFGSPCEVKKEVQELIEIFNKDGGFVFTPSHNIQGNVPIENIIAMLETVKKYR